MLRRNIEQGTAVVASWNSTNERLRVHIFRIWTAAAVLALYVCAWIYTPHVLTWWKRTTTAIIEAGCDRLPYPWGDRIEATIGNFGLWVQITLAIALFRLLVWLVILVSRRIRFTRPRGAERSPAVPAKGRR